MTHRNANAIDLLHCRAEEEFHYCFVHYSDWSEIKDEKFHALRSEYLAVAKKLQQRVDQLYNQVVEDGFNYDDDDD